MIVCFSSRATILSLAIGCVLESYKFCDESVNHPNKLFIPAVKWPDNVMLGKLRVP